MVKRSRLQIYLDVLKAIRDGIEKPTRIMYQTRLSWSILKVALSSLERQGNIKTDEVALGRYRRASKVYRITKKGESALKYFEQGEDLFRLEEADLPDALA